MSFDFDICLLTSTNLSEPHSEDELLARELLSEGLRVHLIAWENWETEAPSTASVLFRTTWGYVEKLSQFKKFLKQLSRTSLEIWNPLSMIRWNLDKKYLLDLKERGGSIVPTRMIKMSDYIEFTPYFEGFETTELIVKPSVGASAAHTFQVSQSQNEDDVIAKLQSLKGQNLIVQPQIESVLQEGEYSLVFIENELTHCVLKSPREGDFRVQTEHGGSVKIVPTPPAALQQARKILAKLSEEPLYARVDLVRSRNGGFLLMELELIEPQLFMDLHPASARSLAMALSKRL